MSENLNAYKKYAVPLPLSQPDIQPNTILIVYTKCETGLKYKCTRLSFILFVFLRVSKVNVCGKSKLLSKIWWNLILFGWISGWGRGTLKAYFWNALRFSKFKPGLNTSEYVCLSYYQRSQESTEVFFGYIEINGKNIRKIHQSKKPEKSKISLKLIINHQQYTLR